MSYSFAIFFGLEMLWKVIGLGADYFQSSGHCIDGGERIHRTLVATGL